MKSFFVPIFSPKVTYLQLLFIFDFPPVLQQDVRQRLFAEFASAENHISRMMKSFGCASFILVVLNVL